MLHRMTVTGQRIVSPLDDPINRNVAPEPDTVGLDDYPFDWYAAYTSPEFDSLEHPQPRIIEWTDGKDERPAHITLADWDAPFNGNQWEPGQVRGRQ